MHKPQSLHLLTVIAKHDTPHVRRSPHGTIAPHVTTTGVHSSQCVTCLCKPDKHPLYACPQFKQMSHQQMVDTLRSHGLCMNCLAPNHFVKQCKSVQCCKRCQKPHHTLLHVDASPVSSTPASVASACEQQINTNAQLPSPPMSPNTPTFIPVGAHFVRSNVATQLKSNALMMTCRVLVSAPDGTRAEARAFDNASFLSERLSQTLRLPRCKQSVSMTGVAGITHHSSNQSVTSFSVSPVKNPLTKLGVTAIIVPKVTSDLPFSPISLKREWGHLSDLDLADPNPSKSTSFLESIFSWMQYFMAGGTDRLLLSNPSLDGYWLAPLSLPFSTSKLPLPMSDAPLVMRCFGNSGI